MLQFYKTSRIAVKIQSSWLDKIRHSSSGSTLNYNGLEVVRVFKKRQFNLQLLFFTATRNIRAVNPFRMKAFVGTAISQ